LVILYFASNSPVWLDRIEDFGGQVNDEKKAIDFPNDDLFEAFYEHLSIHIHSKFYSPSCLHFSF
jgi:hypothetical protein